MLNAEVVQAKTRGHVKCSACELKYTHKDYKLLKDAKKLVYFQFKKKRFCHECFCKLIAEAQLEKKDPQKVMVKDGDMFWVFNFEDWAQ
jgi:hypothetical protein